MKSAVTWLLFSALCVLGATRWLLPGSNGVVPGSVGWALAAGALMATLFAWGLVLRPGRRSRAPAAPPWRWLGGGALLLLGSNLPVWIRPRGLSASEISLALALTAVVIAVAGQAMEEQGREDLAGRLWPPLVTVAALLLVLPEPHLRSWRAVVAVAAIPLLTGMGATVLSRSGGGSAWNLALALTGTLAAALAGAAWHTHAFPLQTFDGTGPFLWRAASDGVSLLLSLAVLMRVGAFRWSAVFAAVPLLTAVESVLLSGGAVTGRVWFAMALLLVACVFLLRPPAHQDSSAQVNLTA